MSWAFRLFNRGFNYFTELYARTVGMLLRVSVLVLVVYGGLLGLTWWGFIERPGRLHSHAGQGLSAGQRATARRRLGRAHRPR